MVQTTSPASRPEVATRAVSTATAQSHCLGSATFPRDRLSAALQFIASRSRSLPCRMHFFHSAPPPAASFNPASMRSRSGPPRVAPPCHATSSRFIPTENRFSTCGARPGDPSIFERRSLFRAMDERSGRRMTRLGFWRTGSDPTGRRPPCDDTAHDGSSGFQVPPTSVRPVAQVGKNVGADVVFAQQLAGLAEGWSAFPGKVGEALSPCCHSSVHSVRALFV
jgi:hypothetical protein